MKLRDLSFVASLLVPSVAAAGGLFLPGSGAVSTSRAGAAVASADDGEALSINPAGLAKTTGWTVTVSAAIIRYSMQFSRRGSYDAVLENPGDPYTGQAYPTVVNDPKPPTGIGQFQPIPVIAIVSDLYGVVPGLHVAAGLYAPNGYPFRDMTDGYDFVESSATLAPPPPPTRYDVMTAESQALFPSLAAAYAILPELDVGLRLTAGRVKSKSTVMVQGTPGNVNESIRHDTQFTADVEDGFVPTFGVGVTYRPLPELELAAVYNHSATVRAKGTGRSIKGPNVDPDRVIGPMPDEFSRCATGGTMEAQKACITTQLPANAHVGARYKFLDRRARARAARAGRLRVAEPDPREPRHRALQHGRRLRRGRQGQLRQPRPPRHLLVPRRRQLPPPAQRDGRTQADLPRRRRLRHRGREGGLAAHELRWCGTPDDDGRRGVSDRALGAQRRRRRRARGLEHEPRRRRERPGLQPDLGRSERVQRHRRAAATRRPPGPRSDEPAAHARQPVREPVQPGHDQVALRAAHARRVLLVLTRS